MRRTWVWGGLSAVASLLVACSATTDVPALTQALPGSLEVTPRAGTLCVPVRSHRLFVVGWETIDNAAETPVTITSVGVARPRGISVRRAWLVDVPDGPFTLVGNWIGAHPEAGSHSARLMRHARVAKGAEIPGGGTVNLVLQLQTVRGGRSGPAEVRYADADGTDHVWRGGSSMVLKPGSTCR